MSSGIPRNIVAFPGLIVSVLGNPRAYGECPRESRRHTASVPEIPGIPQDGGISQAVPESPGIPGNPQDGPDFLLMAFMHEGIGSQ